MFNFIKKIKWSYAAYNLFQKKALAHNLPLYKKYGLNKKYYSPISSKDFEGVESPLNVFDEKDSAIELPKIDRFNELPEKWKNSLKDWSKNGYSILEGFFTEEQVDGFNAEIDILISNQKANWKYQNKIMFAIHISDLIRNAGNNPDMLEVLNLLMGKKVELFQSINFLTASQQRSHSDSIHMSTFPYGNLIATWVALEDITLENGPLHYYPGSHKLPYIVNKDFGNESSAMFLGKADYNDYEDRVEAEIKDKNLKKEVFLAKKGDVLVWHANLLHGGEPLINPDSTRKSMVFHYYTNDAICYHEVTERPTLKR